MSRGLGKMQKLIMDTLRASSAPLSTADLRSGFELEIWDISSEPDFEIWNTPARRRSIRMQAAKAEAVKREAKIAAEQERSRLRRERHERIAAETRER